MTKGRSQYGSSRGVVAVEAVLAFGVFMLSIGGVIIITIGSERLISSADRSFALVSAASDSLVSIRRSAFSDVRSSSSTHATFQEQRTVDLVNPFAKHVTVSLASTLEPRDIAVIQTLIADHESLAGSAPCTALSENRIHFASLGALTISSSANTGTGIAVDGRYAYLSADSPAVNDKDLYVVDISDPTAPWIAASLNTGPGITALTKAGEYLYAANTSRSGQLQILSVADPLHPALLSSLRLPGVSGTGSQGVGNAIAVAGKMAFVGLTKTGSGDEFHIVDIENPHTPHVLGSWPSGTKINGIAAHGEHVFVATPTSDQLRSLDVSDPSHPIVRATFQPDHSTSNNGQAIALLGSYAYFGRNTAATSPADARQFFVLATDSSSSLPLVSTLSIGESVNAIASHTGRLLLGTSHSTKSLQLWETSAPATGTLISSLALPGSPRAIACDDMLVYLALDSNRALSIIELTP